MACAEKEVDPRERIESEKPVKHIHRGGCCDKVRREIDPQPATAQQREKPAKLLAKYGVPRTNFRLKPGVIGKMRNIIEKSARIAHH